MPATWYGGRPQPRVLCVTWGPSPSSERGRSPQFSVNVYCDQTAAWLKMLIGTEVGLGSDDIVLDGDPVPPPRKGRGALSPIFGPRLLWPNGWMDQDGTWHGGGPWSRPHCARWGPSFPPQKVGKANYRPIFIVAKRLDGLRCHLVRR